MPNKFKNEYASKLARTPFFTISLALSLFCSSTVAAQSRVLIDGTDLEKCSVEIDENYFFGISAAKKEIENISFVTFDAIEFIKSIDSKKTCSFIFDVYSKKELIGRVDIVLSKPYWEKISRSITKDNVTANW